MTHGKYTPARHRIIVNAVEHGNYRSTAARMAGIDPATLSTWLEIGREDAENEVPYKESKYRKLYEEVDQKEAEFEAKMLGHVVDAADSEKPNTWQAAMTILERKMPEKFGKRDTTVIQGGNTPIPVATIGILFDGNQRAIANDLLKQLSGGLRESVDDARAIEPGRPGLLQQPED